MTGHLWLAYRSEGPRVRGPRLALLAASKGTGPQAYSCKELNLASHPVSIETDSPPSLQKGHHGPAP